MDIWGIRHFLYEIDSVLSDEQIFQLAEEIFNNKEKLLELIKDEWNKRIMGFIMDWWFIVDIHVNGTLYLQGLDR